MQKSKTQGNYFHICWSVPTSLDNDILVQIEKVSWQQVFLLGCCFGGWLTSCGQVVRGESKANQWLGLPHCHGALCTLLAMVQYT